MFKKLRLKFTFLVFLISFFILAIIDVSLNVSIRVNSTCRLNDQAEYYANLSQDNSPLTGMGNRYVILSKTNLGYVIVENRGFEYENSIMVKTANKIAEEHDSNKGFHEFIYYYINDDKMILIDAKSELDSINLMLIISSIVSTAALFSLTLLAFIFSKFVIRPYEKLYQSQRRFLTDASHELKTPLSIIQADLDVLQSQNENNKWIDSAVNQTDRMRKLILEMITLNKLEELNSTYKKEKFDIASTLLDVIESFQSLKENKNVDFQFDVPESLFIVGNEELFIKLFSILLDNAFKYVDEKGYINVSLKENHKKINICFENSAAELDEEKIKHCFDRFYTFDPARARKSSGFGIGLSIARAIVSEHEGEIKAITINDKKAIRFEINLKK